MKPVGSMSHLPGLGNIFILSRINSIPPIDAYFFTILSNTAPPHLRPGLPKGLFPAGVPVNILKTPTFFHSDYMICPYTNIQLVIECIPILEYLV